MPDGRDGDDDKGLPPEPFRPTAREGDYGSGQGDSGGYGGDGVDGGADGDDTDYSEGDPDSDSSANDHHADG